MSQKSVKLSDLEARFKEGYEGIKCLRDLAPSATAAMAEKLYSSFLFKLFDADAVEYDTKSEAGCKEKEHRGSVKEALKTREDLTVVLNSAEREELNKLEAQLNDPEVRGNAEACNEALLAMDFLIRRAQARRAFARARTLAECQ